MDKNAIIETLDYLFEKFGIAIDWTAENVMPYVQELAEKIVTYKIVTESIWVVLSALIFLGCCGYAVILYKGYQTCKKTENDTWLIETYKSFYSERRFDLSDIGITASIIVSCVAVVSVIALCVCCSCLLKWIFIPELQLIEYVGNLVNGCGV